MTKPLPHIALSYENTIDEAIFRPFVSAISYPDLSLAVDSRPRIGPQAGLQWLVPTAVIIYITRSYFDAFLKEAGKAHYHLLARAIGNLGKTFFGKSRTIHSQLVGSRGKIAAKQEYSFTISIYADAHAGLRFKLLIADDTSAEEFAHIASRFLDFLGSYYSDNLDATLRTQLASARIISRTILVVYDKTHHSFVCLDPVPAPNARIE